MALTLKLTNQLCLLIPQQPLQKVPRALVHYYDPDSPLCASLDIFLESIAQQWRGTRCLRCRVGAGGRVRSSTSTSTASSSVTAASAIASTPSVEAYKDGACVARADDLRQFGGEALT
jgi:hypothetical protein